MSSKLRSSRSSMFVYAVALLVIPACTGVVGGSARSHTDDNASDGQGGSATEPSLEPTVAALGPRTTLDCSSGVATTARTIVRRLTGREYNNTVESLFSGISLPPLSFPPESAVDGFTNNAQAQAPLSGWIERFAGNAESIATVAVKSLEKLLPCKPSAVDNESACSRQFITAFGQRAFRRPVTEAEQAQLGALYDTARMQLPFADSIGVLIQGILQAPGFLYRLEVGTTRQGDLVTLTPYEQATRLAYFLTGTMPDPALFAAAAGGKLKSAADLEFQARRLLEDPRAHDLVAHFHSEWLEFSRMDKLDKDATFFPAFNPAMATSMRTSAARFVERVFWTDGTVKALLNDSKADVDAALAPAYGLVAPAGNSMTLVALNSSQRAGILTQAGILAGLAHRTEHAPILRGVFVLSRFLCAPPPPPVKDFPLPDPKKVVNTTTRQRLESAHESGPCASCHVLIDGIGFGFENYNGVGQWREKDNGMIVNATGTVSGTTDADGPFDGAAELARKLGDSQQVAECVAKQWFKYAFAVDNKGLDDCALQPIVEKFAASKWNMRELMVAIAVSDAFRSRAPEAN